MSVVTPPEEEAVVDTEEPQPSLIKRITSLQSVWILGVLLVIVRFSLSRLAASSFPPATSHSSRRTLPSGPFSGWG